VNHLERNGYWKGADKLYAKAWIDIINKPIGKGNE
jgi:hypothetical protein